MLFVWKPFKLQIKELHIKCIFWFQKLIFRYMFHEFEFLLLKILSCFDLKKNRFSDIRNLNWFFFYIIRYIFWYQKTEKEWRYWFGLMLLVFFSKNLYINTPLIWTAVSNLLLKSALSSNSLFLIYLFTFIGSTNCTPAQFPKILVRFFRIE